MGNIVFACTCGQKMQIEDRFAGQQVKCPNCGASLVAPAAAPVGGPQVTPLAPHRGGAVLALGILGIVVCFICGIVAWVMGNNDLREMAAGRMDPSGEGTTRAGKICGMIGTILAIVILAIYAVAFIFLAAVSVTHTR